jgi:hypothetical protein
MQRNLFSSYAFFPFFMIPSFVREASNSATDLAEV